MAQAMTVRERFHAAASGRPVDRLPKVEWACWWDQTLARWQGEGLAESSHRLRGGAPEARSGGGQPPGKIRPPAPQVPAPAKPALPPAAGGVVESDRYALYDQFGLDCWFQDWIDPGSWLLPRPAHHGAPRIATMDDYRRVRPLLYGDHRADGGPWKAWASRLEGGTAAGWFTLYGFFWWPRVLLGIEPHLYAFADQPELLHAINQDLADWHLRTIDQVCAHAKPDFMTFAEDLSYNHGPMLSKRAFDEFLLPYYRRVVPALRERGIRVVVDSDGDITRCLPWFAAAGIEGILPLERQAGVDVAALQAQQPGMFFIGHFDKMTMPLGEAAMRAEFERLLPAMRRGRFIPSVDHQTPPGVSLEQYRVYLRLLDEYCRLAATGGVAAAA